MILKAFDLQISMTYGIQNMKSIIINDVSYQIIGFLVFLQIVMLSGGLRMKSMKMGHFNHKIIVVLNPILKFFLNLRLNIFIVVHI